MNVEIRPTHLSDIKAMSEDIRESDRLELERSHGHTPYQAMSYGYRHSVYCRTVLYRGEPVAMFGLVPDRTVSDAAAVWMLGTNGLMKMRYSFLRMCRNYIKAMLALYPKLYNYVDVDNTDTQRWLNWCGASIQPARPYGEKGHPFHYFDFDNGVSHV